MSLFENRITFTRHLARLLMYSIDILGLDVIVDEVKRSAEAALWNSQHCKVVVDGNRCEQFIAAHVADHEFRAIGILKSVHRNALAADILIMRDGQIENDPAPYTLLGEWWEKQFEGAAWGGRFDDMGHFSHAYRGRK